MNNKIDISFGMRLSDLKSSKNLVKKTLLSNLQMKGYTAFVDGDVFMADNKIKKANLLFKDNKLIAIDDFDETQIPKQEKISLINLKNKCLTPAIIEQHIHGGYGFNFNTATKEEIEVLLKKMPQNGISEIVATLIPDSIENLNKQLAVLHEVIKNPQKGSTKILGVHLEGPFFSPKKSGIHVPEMLMTPTVENFNKLNFEDIKIVTLAPELDKDYKLTKYLNSKGIITSAGHTMATAEDVKNSGVKQVTHLYNAMPNIQHRDLTATNEALSNDKLYTEIIGDLAHVPPEMMDLTVKVKPKDKIILISDALEGAHSKKDHFFMNGIRVNIADGMAKNQNGTLAGSINFVSDVAKRLVEKTKITFADFIRFSSVNPSKNLGIEKRYQLKQNSKPNFMIWDKKTLSPEKTFTA